GDLLAPEVSGRLDRDLAVADDEQRWLGGAAGDHERVVARGAQVAAHAAARVGVGPRAGERRLADDLDAAGKRRAQAGEETGADREARLRIERIGAGRIVLPHQPRAETVAAEEVA